MATESDRPFEGQHHAQGYGGPLDAPLKGKQMVVNLGPSHPAMHGVTRAVVALEGETIVEMKLDIGFLHRGFEKSCENLTWGQAFPYTDRLNHVSATLNNVGYALLITISDKCCATDSRMSGWPHHQVCTEGNFNSSPRRYRHTAGRKGRNPGACRTPQPTALATATLPRRMACSNPGTPK